MKIVNLVLNNFVNDSRVLKTSKSLSELGYDIQVVALHENDLPTKEEINAIKVHRILLSTRRWPKYRLLQIFKLVEFIIRFVSLYRKAGVLHCNDLNGLLVGCCCKGTRPAMKIVYDSHEYAINDMPNQSALSIKAKYWLERFLIRFTDHVITVSDSIANEYERLYKIPKPHLILNCPVYIEQRKQDLFRVNLGIRSDQTIFLYQGGLGKGRGIELLLQAFMELKNDNNILICMGYGPLQSLIQQRADASANIFFHEAVSPDILLDYTSSADYGISFIEDTCLSYRYCLPNKMFEYIMAGIPVITSNLFEMRSLVEKENIGVVAEKNTVEGFREAIEISLKCNYHNIQSNVYSARKKYCWENQEITLEKIYEGL